MTQLVILYSIQLEPVRAVNGPGLAVIPIRNIVLNMVCLQYPLL